MTMMVGVPVPQGTPDTRTSPESKAVSPIRYRGQTLLYLKGGLALVDLATNGTGQAVNLQTTILNAPFTINGSSIRPGLAVGGGGEMMLSRNWEFRLEYLCTYFGSFSASGAIPGGCAGTVAGATCVTAPGSATVSSKFQDNIVRAALIYRLN